ncbi:hypothetical protein [Spiroplasma culicicola]|uniref:Transmembrane protein n=1 Tax=Spiroplasma culicicola AES-1 TaxID=1276246 RepID=W6A6P4_9MOLU|nr:hypothetical protein [Spiroplasma culicicola]AHI52641.1 hypothetical protein SCULI_v1c03000 [Spiroplasma culicicola AES-1]
MTSWELSILFPIILVGTLGVLFFVVFKEKIKKNSWLFLLETFAFWIATSFVGYQVANQFSEIQSSVSKTQLIIIILFSSSLFTIFLKPLATFFTGLIRSRKTWLWISYTILFIQNILLIFMTPSVVTSIINALMYAILLSTSTIHFLYFNEQFYYRINTLPVTWIIFTLIGSGSIFGLFIFDIQTIVFNVDNLFVTNIILALVAIGCIVLNIFKKEIKNLAGVFDSNIIEQLPKKNNINFLVIYFLTFLLVLSYSMLDSNLVKQFLQIKLISKGYNQDFINSFLNLNQILSLSIGTMSGYLIYKYVLKYFGQKYLFIINLFILFTLYATLSFVTNPFIVIVINILVVIAYNQLLYTLFSFCMFWNYRSPKNPVTGFFGSALFGAQYLSSSADNLFNNSQNSFVQNIHSIIAGEITDLTIIQEHSDQFRDIITIIFAIASLLVLVALLVYYFTSNKIIADFVNYRLAMQNLKTILKKRMIEKTKTQIDVENLDANE